MVENAFEKEWRNYHIPDIFEIIQRGKRLKKSDHILGVVPYVSSTAANNGVDGYVKPVEGVRIFKDCISLANSGSVGSAFYEPFEYVASDHVTCLKTEGFTPYQYLFLTAPIQKQSSNFNFNREINNQRVMALQIMLPVDESGEPDYKYMEEYVCQKREMMLAKYCSYIENRIIELGDEADIPSLQDKDWKPVKIVSMFNLVRGRESNMSKLDDGDIPLISAKNGSNGLKRFVDASDRLIKGNCITLNNDGDGGAGLAYYQPADMALDTHVTALVPKNSMNMYVMIFIAKSLSGLHGFFGHGLSISNKRAQEIRIMLPVDESGYPDYEYMEQYVRNMMIRKSRKYLEYLRENRGRINK